MYMHGLKITAWQDTFEICIQIITEYYTTCNNQIINNSDYYRNLYSDDYAFET